MVDICRSASTLERSLQHFSRYLEGFAPYRDNDAFHITEPAILKPGEDQRVVAKVGSGPLHTLLPPASAGNNGSWFCLTEH